MADSLAGVALAAGAGTRLRPLTALRPKPLCPVGNVPLVDLAVDRLRRVTESVAVNVHHGRAAMEAHLAGRVHLSIERDQVLGTAGALGALRPWIDQRPVLLTNADAWLPPSLDVARFVDEWDGERPRLLVTVSPGRGDWGDLRYVGLALLPWREVRDVPAEPAGLHRLVWGRLGVGGLDLVRHDGPAFDCGTPRDYLTANLAVSEGTPVIGPGADAQGTVVRSVVWPGAVVRPGETLVDAIRADHRITVLVRRPSGAHRG